MCGLNQYLKYKRSTYNVDLRIPLDKWLLIIEVDHRYHQCEDQHQFPQAE
jgi:hypothetical protein